MESASGRSRPGSKRLQDKRLQPRVVWRAERPRSAESSSHLDSRKRGMVGFAPRRLACPPYPGSAGFCPRVGNWPKTSHWGGLDGRDPRVTRAEVQSGAAPFFKRSSIAPGRGFQFHANHDPSEILRLSFPWFVAVHWFRHPCGDRKERVGPEGKISFVMEMEVRSRKWKTPKYWSWMMTGKSSK